MSRGRKKGELEVQLERKLQTQGRKKSTIDAYCGWYRRYVRDIYREYGRFIHPRELREDAFEDWLTGLERPRRTATGRPKLRVVG